MSLQKNVASQKWIVFAFDRTDNTPKAGDAAQITANLRLDGGAANAVDDTNPTELEDGFYVFDITQAESNADLILMTPASSTGDIQVIGVPGAVYTTAPNFNALGIESDGDLTKVNLCDTNTDVRGTDSAATAASLATAQLDLDTITGADGANLLSATQTSIDAIETDTAAMQPLVAKIPLSDGTISWNATALGAINAECDTAISDASLATAADLLDKLGAVNEAAAAGDPSATESVMQYVKQIINVLTGTTGIVTMPAAAAPANNVSIAEMVRSIYDDTNSLDGTKLPDTLSLANINAEVDTALVTTTYAEPAQGAPLATASLKDKIGYLFKAWRNRSNQTATTYQLFNDDATTVDHKATVSDDTTTAEKGEVATGP